MIVAFAPMSAGQLGAGSVFEVKCLFAIDAIAAVYRAEPRIQNAVRADQAGSARWTMQSAMAGAKGQKARAAELALPRAAS